MTESSTSTMSLNDIDSDSDDTGTIGPDFDMAKMFETASKLKSAQLSKIRKEYESSPGFIKATQVYASRNNEWKNLSITEKLSKCESFKEEGNKFFNNKNYINALNSYSEGISIFRYFEKKDERGEHLELKDYILDGYFVNSSSILFWDDQQNYNKAKTLIISLLLNCATACLSLRQHPNVIWCSQTVLKYDSMNVKALYRMCQSHEKLDTTFDLEYALKYITRAKMINPRNKAIMIKFDEIKKELRTQNMKDRKQFNGLFNRGSLYEDKEIIVKDNNLSSNIISKCTNLRHRCCDKFTYCVVL